MIYSPRWYLFVIGNWILFCNQGCALGYHSLVRLLNLWVFGSIDLSSITIFLPFCSSAAICFLERHRWCKEMLLVAKGGSVKRSIVWYWKLFGWCRHNRLVRRSHWIYSSSIKIGRMCCFCLCWLLNTGFRRAESNSDLTRVIRASNSLSLRADHDDQARMDHVI